MPEGAQFWAMAEDRLRKLLTMGTEDVHIE
jgi:hypothetical protein